LTWAAVPGATSYTVKRSTAAAGPFVTVKSGVPTLGYTDTGLANNALVFYAVNSVDATGFNGPNSAPVEARAGAPLDPPVSYRAVAGASGVTVAWSPVSGARSYIVSRAPSPGGPYVPILTNSSFGGYTDTAVVNGTAYFYEVCAVDVIGNAGVNTDPFGVRAGAVPSSPIAWSVRSNSSSVLISWLVSTD